MKNEANSIKALGVKRYNTKKSTLNLELSLNCGAHQTVESRDATVCMYDYAKEILELMESSEDEDGG